MFLFLLPVFFISFEVSEAVTIRDDRTLVSITRRSPSAGIASLSSTKDPVVHDAVDVTAIPHMLASKLSDSRRLSTDPRLAAVEDCLQNPDAVETLGMIGVQSINTKSEDCPVSLDDLKSYLDKAGRELGLDVLVEPNIEVKIGDSVSKPRIAETTAQVAGWFGGWPKSDVDSDDPLARYQDNLELINIDGRMLATRLFRNSPRLGSMVPELHCLTQGQTQRRASLRALAESSREPMTMRGLNRITPSVAPNLHVLAPTFMPRVEISEYQNYDAHTRVAREEVILREGIGTLLLLHWYTSFGCLITKAPIVFERTMPYQIKFNALALVFWSSSDLGVLEARLGPQSRLITTGRILSTFGSVVYATACCAVAEFKPFLAYKMVIFGELFMSATTVLRSVAGAFIDFDVLPSDALEGRWLERHAEDLIVGYVPEYA
ncbi:Suppressor of the cold-sensitive snRNP bioproteinsis mutant brr1-1 [Perkinsus olseni]|uniref:Suppressor of the cold-sensitive snRNP bioproteinsis mutant brr1-1 n=1 Tax=Perkinsus olseni TaxID=32597 RepID=A0A7J6P8Z0_PEROL|nr:Suppressor of the cold-sensitive snRNP bioproteinsis mutant brr1-1 [Perkinsus olseni]